MGIQDTDVGIVAFAYETVTVANTAIGLTSATYLNAIRATITLDTAQIRMRLDGTNPTATIGHIINIDDVIYLEGTRQLPGFKVIRTGATSGVLSVTYFR